MELEPKERAVIETYLKRKKRMGKGWILILLFGLLLCGLAIVYLFAFPDEKSQALVILLASFVVVARALDDRQKTILSSAIQKYHAALSKNESENHQQ
ncbi:MAG: hypothetical protein ACLFWL_12585 [Candidatus Brocadiia bacterium]